MTMDAAEIALVRKTFEAALNGATNDATALLAELGWWELYDAEPQVATGELFEAQGRLGVATSALDVAAADACGEGGPATPTAFLHPRLSAWDRPSGRLDADGTVRFDGLVLAGLERAERLLVPFDACDGLGVVTVDVAALDLVRTGANLDPSPGPMAATGAAGSVRSVAGLDPSLGLVALTGAVALPGRAGPPTGAGWVAVAGAARRALAHELCGLAQAMLDTAAAYVTDRHQFGRPIAAFQTVRHRLTEVFVALASARAALDASWAVGDPLLADAAKALAGRAGLLASRHCLQVTGAIGFTEEYDLAARIRRVQILDALYGGTDALQSRIGARLLADRAVPRLHPLP